jgi:flagellar hook-associated protein 1
MSVFGVGKSALAAAQAGISTTGHNIANANTPGYSRQEIVQAASEPQQSGSGYFGQGVQVTTVKRIYNEVLGKQALSAQSASNSSGTYAAKMSKIDSMLSDPEAGLTPALKDFFASLSKLSANPGDAPTRQTVLSASQSLSNRFNSLGKQLSDMQSEVNTQIPATVSTINTYTTQIAALNDTIEKAYNATGQAPNDLLDQRDQLVTELSKQIQTTTVNQGNSYNVFIGNGLPVVVGSSAYSLSPVNSVSDSSRLEVAYTGAGQSSAIQLGTNTLTGGTLGGLLDFREKSLDGVQNQLGQIAIVLASTVNAQQAAGKDLNGNTGAALTNFFSTATPVSTANSSNTGNATISAAITNTSALTSSNYSLQYNGSNYIITRLSDNQQMSSTATLPQVVDGVTFTLASGSMSSGDSFLIRPTVGGATSFQFLMTQTSQIAAASASAPANSIKGDGTNAILLNKLEINSLIYNGSTLISYSSAFNQLVSAVGVKSNELNVTNQAEANMLTNITNEQASTSGVNLDEEAANLMRYQQAYQAAGKFMQIANQMFNTLLSLAS